MSDWQPKKGDRVMVNDETWEHMVGYSRSHGRRGGVVVGFGRAYPWLNYAWVRWDGRKTACIESFDVLMPDDPRRHTLPPKIIREQAKADKEQPEVKKMRARLRQLTAKSVLTSALSRKLARALDAVERGDFNDPE